VRGANALRAQPGLLGARADQGGSVGSHLGSLGLLDPDRDRGDVVAPAGFVGHLDQAADRFVEILRLTEQCGNPVVLDHRRQSVRTEQEDVIGPGAEAEGVDLDVGLRAERPGDDRALRVVLGLLVGDPALAAELLDQRVIGRQHPQRSVTHHVGAAVADVADDDVIAVDQQRGQRRPHAGAGRVVLGERMDPRVRLLDDPAQEGFGRLVRLALRRLEQLGGGLRRDLAGLGAAHPVGDREQRRTRVVGVLVRGPLAAGIGPEGLLADSERHQCSPGIWSSKRNSVSPILIWSRSESSASPWSLPPLR
jgi:hypothetical protein